IDVCMAYYLVISSPRYLVIWIALLIFCAGGAARAQDPPPKIGPFVVDVHGTVPSFPQAEPLAASRELALAELPGHGLGMQLAAPPCHPMSRTSRRSTTAAARGGSTRNT